MFDFASTDSLNSEQNTTQYPVYVQLAMDLRANIAKQYAAGDYLPSENALAQQYKVNRHTVRRALDELVVAGLIERQRGKGTLVLDTEKVRYALHVGKFTDSIKRSKRSTESELLLAQQVVAPVEVALAMGFTAEEAEKKQVIELQTKRFVDGKPVTLIRHYMHPVLAAGIKELYRGGSLHQTLHRQFGYHLQRARADISASLPTPHEMYVLGCHSTMPMLRVFSTNVIRGKRDSVVEVSMSCSRSDRLEIQVEY